MRIETDPAKEKYSQQTSRLGCSFQQSWEWGEYEASLGKEIRRFLFFDDEGKDLGAATFIADSLPLGIKYWFSPRGPVVERRSVGMIPEILAACSQTCRGSFLRFEPETMEKISGARIRRAPKDYHARATLILNLADDEAEMLKRMHQKARYNIRLAEKRGVRVRFARTEEFETFFALLKETAQKDSFFLHDEQHYRKLLNLPFIHLILAESQNRVVAGVIVSFYNNRATYLHGASAYEFRHLMAPYLIQWQAVRVAKEKGLKEYDFGGVRPKDGSLPSWEGLTKFKQGFGGEYREWIGTFDYILNPLLYWIYRLGRRIRL